MGRWRLGLAMLALAGMVVLSTAAATAQGPRVKMREVHTGTIFMAPVFIAEAAGYFADEGIDLELFEVDSGALATAALVARQADIADIDPFQSVELRRQGKQILLIYNLTKRVTLDMVMHPEVARTKGISRSTPLPQRLAALRGLKLGITRPGAATDVYMRYYLKRAGMDPDRDVQLIAIGGGGSLLAALRTRQIDAFHLSAPTPHVAEQDGYGVFIIKGSAGDVPELDGIVYTGIAVHNVYANRNPDVLRRWIRATQKGYRLMRTDPTAAVTHLRKHVARDPALLARLLPDLISALSEDGRMSEQIMQRTLDFLFEIGEIRSKPSAKEGILWTNRYLRP